MTIAKNLETYPSDVGKKLIQSGDDAFDLLQTTVEKQASMAVDGYLANMNDLPYVNFEKAWWDSSTMEGIRVGDKTFYALGDSALNGKKASWLMLFNKTLTDKAASRICTTRCARASGRSIFCRRTRNRSRWT